MRSMSESRGVDPVGVSALREAMSGHLLVPGVAGYDKVRRVWNATADRKPALIARCADVTDVQRALGFAIDHDLPVARASVRR